MLLHILLIVLFGNPVGGTRRSEAWWGPLDVTLRPAAQEPGSEFRVAPGLEPNSPGAALLERSGAAPKPPPESPRRALEPRPTAPAPGETLPRLNPSAPEEVDKSLAPAEISPTTVEKIAPPVRARALTIPAEPPSRSPLELPALPIEKAVAPSSEPQLAPPVELAPRAVPAAPAAPLEPAVPPPLERELAPAPELPPREAPVTPSAPLEGLAPAPIERPVAPPVELPPRAAPTVPAAPIERLAPAPLEQPVAPPVELPPRVAPTVPAAPIERLAPPTIERQLPPAEVPLPRAERPAPAIAPPASPLPSAPGLSPRPPSGPDAGEEIFKPRRDTATPPGDAPHIDLDAARKKAAREVVSEGAGSRGVFTIPSPPSVESKSKEKMPLEKALKPDCRTAYANMGLLAAPVLIASAIAADGSCRW